MWYTWSQDHGSDSLMLIDRTSEHPPWLTHPRSNALEVEAERIQGLLHGLFPGLNFLRLTGIQPGAGQDRPVSLSFYCFVLRSFLSIRSRDAR